MLIAAAAVLLVAAPLLFTSSGFGLDFTNHLWLNWVEGTGLAQAGHPSYFLSARGIGVFYPFFAFYGGTLYTIVGGIAVVTSAYYITNLYGRGAWTEFIAVSAIAPLLASAVRLVRRGAWRPWPVLVFVVSAVLFSGSHNITLVWGTTLMAVAAVVVWLALDAPRRLPVAIATRRG